MIVAIEGGVVGLPTSVNFGEGPNGEIVLMISGPGGRAFVILDSDEAKHHAAMAGFAAINRELAAPPSPDAKTQRPTGLFAADGSPLQVRA
jgi:hypothetical protein